jgi:hypothetical protein
VRVYIYIHRYICVCVCVCGCVCVLGLGKIPYGKLAGCLRSPCLPPYIYGGREVGGGVRRVGEGRVEKKKKGGLKS